MDPHYHGLPGPKTGLLHRQVEAPAGAFRQLDSRSHHAMRTPLLLTRALWERSGRAAQMSVLKAGGRSLALKPISDPGRPRCGRACRSCAPGHGAPGRSLKNGGTS